MKLRKHRKKLQRQLYQQVDRTYLRYVWVNRKEIYQARKTNLITRAIKDIKAYKANPDYFGFSHTPLRYTNIWTYQ